MPPPALGAPPRPLPGPPRRNSSSPSPSTAPRGFTARCTRALLSPWSRLSLLVLLLVSAAATVLLFEPQKLLADGWPPQLNGAAAAVVFAVAYGLCTVAFVPRPLLNLAAGALFGSQLGLGASLGGTVLGAGIAFGLGRILGQDALRPLLRGRWLKAADGQLSRHGFRSMMAARLFPGVPFWAANYCASVSRMGWFPFLLATAPRVDPEHRRVRRRRRPRLGADVPRLPDRAGLHRAARPRGRDRRLAQAPPLPGPLSRIPRAPRGLPGDARNRVAGPGQAPSPGAGEQPPVVGRRLAYRR